MNDSVFFTELANDCERHGWHDRVARLRQMAERESAPQGMSAADLRANMRMAGDTLAVQLDVGHHHTREELYGLSKFLRELGFEQRAPRERVGNVIPFIGRRREGAA